MLSRDLLINYREMNRINFLFVAILMSLVFFSCRPMRIVDIETYNPSAITFPPEVKTVMIVNNSAQQPDGVGHRYTSKIKGDSIISVSADSTAYTFCMALGKAIAESPLFVDVRICEDTLRRDSIFYNIEPFSIGEVDMFCRDYDVDALIALDKVFFKTTYYDKEMAIVHGNTISAMISGELRVLWPGQKDAYKVPFQDSLSWTIDSDGYFYYSDIEKEVLMQSYIKSAMLYISEVVGRKIHTSVVPHWSEDNRWYYTNISSVWKSGSVYAAAAKWSEAEKIWEPLYKKSDKWKHKARLSSNLALCNEMKGDLEKAVEYAKISYDLFKEHDKEDSTFINLQKAYIDILDKRKQEDGLLSKQLQEIDK